MLQSNPLSKRTDSLPFIGSIFTLVAVCLFAAANAFAEDTGSIRRFSLVAGANDGGSKRPVLRYAHNDARAVARVLEQLGGVDGRDSVVLIEPNRFDFEAGLARLRERLRRSRSSGQRLEVLFYYSGHSDEQGLMLGNDIITYRELREAISELPADVRIAVLDSCSSGVLTRTKGGTRKAPFLIDTSVDVKGYAFLTSSSADESAQESDKVGGSFFTHYFVSGLRGAADSSKDNKVTLNEAYQYAFDETLARTESTQAGPQHPSYDFQLKGSGDLVLTDLRGTPATLVFPKSLSGRVFIRNQKGQLVAEINKRPGIPVVLGLEAGQFEATLEDKDTVIRGTFVLRRGEKKTFDPHALSAVDKEATVSRGNEVHKPPSQPPSNSDEVVLRPFSASFAPKLTTDARVPGKTKNRFSINFIGWGDYLEGAEFGFLGNIRKESVNGFQAGGIFNFTRGEMRGFQWAGFGNVTGSATMGFQGAGIVNFLGGPFAGFQGAGIGNINGKGSSHGFQGAGVFNFNRTGAVGFQGAGFVNVNVGFLRGFGAASVANMSLTGDSRGFQGAGVFNYARRFRGAQIAAVANIASAKIRGLQLGLVNYARKASGLQLGLVNVAGEHSGATVGLVNVVGDGMFVPSTWWSYSSAINLGIKAGSRKVYSILGYGSHPIGNETKHRDSVIAGIGGHIEMDPLWIEIDLTHHFVRRNYLLKYVELDVISKLRVTVGWRLSNLVSLFAGPALSFHTTENSLIDDIFSLRSDSHPGGIQTHLGLGFFGGIQFEPKFGRVNQTHRDRDVLVD